MKSFAFLCLLLPMTAYADLAGEYASRRDALRAESEARERSEAVQSAHEIVESVGKSKVLSGPDRVREGEQRERWYYRMRNGKICQVALATDNQGNLLFAFPTSAGCY